MTPCSAVNVAGLACPRPGRFRLRCGRDVVISCGTHLSGWVDDLTASWALPLTAERLPKSGPDGAGNVQP